MACILPSSCLLRNSEASAPNLKCSLFSNDLRESCSSVLSFSSRYKRPHTRSFRIHAAVIKVPKFTPRRKKRVGPNYSEEQQEWDQMMREVERSPRPVEVLKSYAQDGNMSRKTIIGTLFRFKQLRNWKIMIQFTEWLIEQGWYTFNQMDYFLLLLAYCKSGQVENAENLMKKLEKLGIPASIEMYTLQIDAYGRKRWFDKAESVFQTLVSSGPAPTALTYQTMMKTYSEAGKLEDVERIFRMVTESSDPGVKPDSRMYNLMIHTFGKLGKVEDAMGLYEKMKKDRVAMTVVTFNSLISFQKTWRDAEDIYRQLQDANVVPDVFTFTALLNAYAKAKRVESAQAVFDDMTLLQIRPNQVAYNALINAYSKAKDAEGAMEALKRMKLDGCLPTVESYTAVIAAYVNLGDMENAEKMLMTMRDDRVRPNIRTFCVLMTGYVNENDLESMARTYQRMKLSGIQPDRHVYTVLVNAYGSNRDFDTAMVWYKQMMDAGFKPDPILKTVLLKIATDREQKVEVHELLGTDPPPEEKHTDDEEEDGEGSSSESEVDDEQHQCSQQQHFAKQKQEEEEEQELLVC